MTSTFILRGRCGTLLGRRGTRQHSPSFCVAGVAYTTLLYTIFLRGRRGTLRFAPLSHTCESWFKVFFCQVLSRDLASTLSTLAGELSRSDGEDTLEEQTYSPATTQTGRCVRKALREAAGCSIAGSRPSRCAGRLFVPCALHHTSHTCYRTVIALSGKVVAELFVLKGQPWLDAIPFGCWCHCWNVASFHLSDKDTVVFPRPRLSQLVPSHGPYIVLKLITSNDPVNIRVVIGCHLCGLQTAAWHQSALRILRASDAHATKFGPGSTARR